MLIALASHLIPGFRAACIRLRLNHGKTSDIFSDLWELIDHYLKKGELNRAEALSNSLITLAEGESMIWEDPELALPVRKSLRYQKDHRRNALAIFVICGLFLLTLSQHEWILPATAKAFMRSGNFPSAIALLRSELALNCLQSRPPNFDAQSALADALVISSPPKVEEYYGQGVYVDIYNRGCVGGGGLCTPIATIDFYSEENKLPPPYVFPAR